MTPAPNLAVPSIPVARWPLDQKMIEAARRATPKLPGPMQQEFLQLFDPTALAATSAVLVAWAAAHAFGVGFVLDVVLLLTAAVSIGALAFEAAGEVRRFAVTARDARTEADLERAAEHLARAVAIVGVQAFVALVTRGAARRIGKVPLTYAARVARFERIAARVGVRVKAPLQRERLAVALDYFDRHFYHRSEVEWISWLDGIDFHRPVVARTLPVGTQLVAYREAKYTLNVVNRGELLRSRRLNLGPSNYFSTRGTPPTALGIAPQGKELVRYRVRKPVDVLESTADSMRVTWGERAATFERGRPDQGQLATGGGKQFLVPDMNSREFREAFEITEIARPPM